MLASAGLSVVALLAGKENIPSFLPVAVLLLRGMSGITAATWVNFSVLCASGSRGTQVSAMMSSIIVPQSGSQAIAMLLNHELIDSNKLDLILIWHKKLDDYLQIDGRTLVSVEQT